MTSNRVVLPAPLGPTKAVEVPGENSVDTFERTLLPFLSTATSISRIGFREYSTIRTILAMRLPVSYTLHHEIFYFFGSLWPPLCGFS